MVKDYDLSADDMGDEVDIEKLNLDEEAEDELLDDLDV